MKIKKLLLLFVLTISLVSCMFTEEIYLKNDGSGTYTFKMDMSQMVESMKEISTKDSLKPSKIIDSVIYFKDILELRKDSILQLEPADRQSLEALADLRLHMFIDEEEDKMLLDFSMDFKELAELKNMQDKISKAQALNENKGDDSGLKSKADIVYSYKKNIFKREVIMKNLTDDELDDVEKSIKQSDSFLDGTMYKIIYHFESPIKKVSYKGAQISDDKKTMTIEVPLDSVMKNPKWLDFEVKLKR